MNLSVLPAHPPALVAKQVATLDVLSEGRVTLAVGCFYALGVPDPATTLRDFTADYLAFVGADFADRFAATLTAFDADAVNRAIDGAEEAGLDEFVLVPASPEVAVLEATMELVGAR